MRKDRETEPAEGAFADEPFLKKDQFLPHILTVVNNAYTWHTSRLYLGTIGIGLNETRIISILYEFGKLYAWEITEHLSMNKATVSRSLRVLEDAGLIAMESTRRGRLAVPTIKSQEVHRHIIQMARTREELLLNGFTDDERSKFLEFLNRINGNMPACISYVDCILAVKKSNK